MDATITAQLTAPVVGQIPILDGPLAWAWIELEKAAGREIDPITDEHCPDADLPLARWEHSGTWGWKVSAPIADPAHHTAVDIRRKPAVIPMARYSPAREHHSGLGPMKARNTRMTGTWYRSISWHAEVTDRADLEALLAVITHLGGRHRNGFGAVASWMVDDGPEDGWRARPMPPTYPARAPYWHPARRAC